MNDEPPPRPADRDNDPLDIDTTVAQPARVQSYLAGGDAHFAVDRQLGDYLRRTSPDPDEDQTEIDFGRAGAESHLVFAARAVHHLAGEAGVRQLLCFGATVPLLDHVHAAVQQVAPDARVVYVGRDPVVLAHAHTVRRSAPEGATAYINGGLRDLPAVLREAAETLDLTRPVAVLLISVLNLVRDERDPHRIVAQLMKALVSGSYLAVAHPTSDLWPEGSRMMADHISTLLQRPFVLRTHAEISRFFDGLELVEGGLVQIDEWRRPEGQPPPPAQDVTGVYAGVARKP